MERETAKRLLAAALALDRPLGELDGVISELEEGEEKDECRRALGDLMRITTLQLVFRVYRRYPELDPDR